jgi:ABC-type nitrate/sulfonate/bicarbonate transport system permease component
MAASDLVTVVPERAARGALPRAFARSSRSHRWVLGLLGIALAFGVWQLTSVLANNPAIYPSATSAFSDVGTIFTGGNLSSVIVASLIRLVIGFALSAAIGVLLGLLIGYVRVAREYLSTVIDFLRSIPFPLLLPLMIAVFKFGSTTVILLVVLTSVWPVLVNTADAARSVDPLTHDVVRVCRLRGVTAFRRVYLPAILPEILAGLRVAIGVSLAALVIAEMIGASNGIGYFISNSESSFDSRATYAGVIVLACVGWVADTAFLALERRALRGRPG